MLVNYKGKNLYSFADKFRLIPGINEVEESLFETARTHPIFAQRMESGQIEVIQSTKDKDGKTSLSEMKRNIPNIFDRKLLEKIVAEDTREIVQKLAIAQLEKIKHPAPSGVEHFGGSNKGE